LGEPEGYSPQKIVVEEDGEQVLEKRIQNSGLRIKPSGKSKTQTSRKFPELVQPLISIQGLKP